MKSAFRKSFTRDLKKIKERQVLQRLRQAIDEVESADDLSAVGNLKKISGAANLPNPDRRLSDRDSRGRGHG